MVNCFVFPIAYFESKLPFKVRLFLNKVGFWTFLGKIVPILAPVIALSAWFGEIFTWTGMINNLLAIYLAMSIDFNNWKKDGYPLPSLEAKLLEISIITYFLETSSIEPKIRETYTIESFEY